MIYCLTGKLLEKAPDYAVVSCGGVGYLGGHPVHYGGRAARCWRYLYTVYLYECHRE